MLVDYQCPELIVLSRHVGVDEVDLLLGTLLELSRVLGDLTNVLSHSLLLLKLCLDILLVLVLSRSLFLLLVKTLPFLCLHKCSLVLTMSAFLLVE